MDKYEFSLKMDQMKKLVHEEDYRTALKIVDSIDWNRVRNTNLLTMAATVYERNSRLREARKILEQALERSPVGKRILFKLTEVAVEMGDLKAAEDYYYEYRQVDPEDVNIYVLQFLILRGRQAEYDRQLQPLELYCEQETDERWFYELAETYDRAGRYDDCIRMCDKIALMFGSSTYAEKALRLKMKHASLTGDQMDILYPHASAGDTARASTRSYDGGYATGRTVMISQGDREADLYTLYGLSQEPDPESSQALKQAPAEEFENAAAKKQEAARNSDALAALRYDNEDDEFEAYVRAMEIRERTPVPVLSAASAQVRTVPVPGVIAAQAAASQVYNNTAARTAASYSSIPELPEEEPSDEGVQMAFDFGGSQGEPRLVEEEELQAAPTPPVPAGTAGSPQSTVAVNEDIGGSAAAIGNAGAGAVTAAVPAPGETTDQDAAAAFIGSVIAAAAPVQAKPVIVPQPVPVPQPVTIQAAPLPPAQPAQPKPAPGPQPVPVPQPVTVQAAPLPPAQPVQPAVPVQPLPVAPTQQSAQARPAQAVQPAASARPAVPTRRFDMIVEAETVEDGVRIAVEELRQIHEEYNVRHSSAKTTADKLNKIGLTNAVLQKMSGKDFVIEAAGDLKGDIIRSICRFIRSDRSGTIVVLVDTPEGLDAMEDACPEIFDICDYVSDIEEEPEQDVYEEDSFDDGFDDGDDLYEEHDRPYSEAGSSAAEEEADEPAEPPRKRSDGEVKETFSNVRPVRPSSSGEEMEIDDFAQYCSQYAAEIDCSITGTSMLALYEKIELLEEEGVRLTRENAEKLIEEAADRAEKPPLSKRITGMFHSKYDKNGCLILKESDFIY